MKTDKVIATINHVLGAEILAQARIKDEMANGIQVYGASDTSKVALGVSCNEEFLSTAADWGAQLCLFHHGIDTRTDRSIYPISTQKRLRVIFENNMTIASYHYALDAHPALGNNAQIASKLNAQIVDNLFEDWGFVAELSSPKSVKLLKEECGRLFAHDILAVGDLDKQVVRLGIVSGAAKPHAHHIHEMHQKGVELFITGETSESVPYKMKEEGIAYFAGGHYATEVFGVKALGEELKDKLGNVIEVKFIDVPNIV